MFALGIFGMFGGVLFPLIFIGLIVFSIRAIVMTVRVPARASREPACEVCRYRVAGLSALTCPECGTDLRATGIITLPMEVRRRGSMLAAIFGWIYLMFIVGGIVIAAISAFQFAPVMTGAAGSSMTTTTPLTPASKAYTRVDTVATINYGSGMPGGTVDFELVLKDKSVWKLAYPPLTANYTITDPTGAVTTTPDDGKGPDALFAAAGLDMTDAKVSSEARELSTVVGVMAASPWTAVNTIKLRAFTAGSPAVTGPMVGNAPNEPKFIVALIVGLVLWIGLLAGGIVFIVLKRKKLLRRYATAPTNALPPEVALPQG